MSACVRSCALLAAFLWVILGARGFASAVSVQAQTPPLSYLALEPVRDWDIDVIYRYEQRERERTSLTFAYEENRRDRRQEIVVGVRRRLGPRSVGLLQAALTEQRVDAWGRRLDSTGWDPFHVKGQRTSVQPLTVGWRREAGGGSGDSVSWGVDAQFYGRPGIALVPQGRWLWLWDPVLLSIEVALPWNFSRRGPPALGRLSARVTVDHAVNRRLVLSGGFGVTGREPVALWGWSLQVRPDRFWSVQLDLPARSRGWTLQTGWRFRL